MSITHLQENVVEKEDQKMLSVAEFLTQQIERCGRSQVAIARDVGYSRSKYHYDAEEWDVEGADQQGTSARKGNWGGSCVFPSHGTSGVSARDSQGY